MSLSHMITHITVSRLVIIRLVIIRLGAIFLVPRGGFKRPRLAGGFPVAFVVALVSCLLWVSPSAARPAPDGFADLAERLLPAVVNISTTQEMQQSEMEPNFPVPKLPPGSPFEDFFRDFMERGRPNPHRNSHSLGSGFVIDSGGYIVTNNHVIAEASEVRVIFHDGKQLEAEVIGRDDKTDLALLKVESDTPLVAVPFADSDQARVGDWVVAIGNPYGLGGTVTAGIISARARDINSGPYDDYIQTDASINRGNSGGPLFNLQGEVVGVNTAIFSPTGGSIGIGFSIPANLAKPVLAQLREFGQTRRGWLGVRIQQVTDEIADSLGMKEETGALVAKVNPGEPAAKAGIKPGDVIIEFDGKLVPGVRKLQRIVAETDINRPVRVTVWRDEGEKVLTVTVGELESFEKAALSKSGDDTTQTTTQFDGMGMTLSSLTPNLRRQFDLKDVDAGVVITDVDKDGQAAERGLRQGDVIVEVGQEEVNSPDQISQKLEEAAKKDKKSVLFLVEREGDLRFIPMKLRSG